MRRRAAIGLATLVCRALDVGATQLDGKVVMISEHHGKYYGLDEVGSQIWKLIEMPRTLAEICDELHGVFDVERPQLERDVVAFVSRLLDERLIEVVSDLGEIPA